MKTTRELRRVLGTGCAVVAAATAVASAGIHCGLIVQSSDYVFSANDSGAEPASPSRDADSVPTRDADLPEGNARPSKAKASNARTVLGAGLAYTVGDLDGDGIDELVAAKAGTGADAPTAWYAATLAGAGSPKVLPFAQVAVVDPSSGRPIWGPGSTRDFFVGHFTSSQRQTVCAMNKDGGRLVCFDAVGGAWSVATSQPWGPLGIYTVVDFDGDGTDELLTTPPPSTEPAGTNAGFTLYSWTKAGFVQTATSNANGDAPSPTIALANLGGHHNDANAHITALLGGNITGPDDFDDLLVEWGSATTDVHCAGLFGNHPFEGRRHIWWGTTPCSGFFVQHAFTLGDADGDGFQDLFAYLPTDSTGTFYYLVAPPPGSTRSPQFFPVAAISPAGFADFRTSARTLLFGRFRSDLPSSDATRHGVLGLFDSGSFAVYDPTGTTDYTLRIGVDAMGSLFP